MRKHYNYHGCFRKYQFVSRIENKGKNKKKVRSCALDW